MHFLVPYVDNLRICCTGIIKANYVISFFLSFLRKGFDEECNVFAFVGGKISVGMNLTICGHKFLFLLSISKLNGNINKERLGRARDRTSWVRNRERWHHRWGQGHLSCCSSLSRAPVCTGHPNTRLQEHKGVSQKAKTKWNSLPQLHPFPSPSEGHLDISGESTHRVISLFPVLIQRKPKVSVTSSSSAICGIGFGVSLQVDAFCCPVTWIRQAILIHSHF